MGHKIATRLLRAKDILANVDSTKSDATSLQRSVWFAAGRSYSKLLFQDKYIRAFLTNELKSAGLVEIVIRRYFRRVEIAVYVTKPGVVIGKGGATINKLRETLVTKFKLPKDVKLNIEEFKDPNKSALVIANDIAQALAKNVPYRRLVKTYLERIKYSGIQGAKISVKGRLNKAEIARKEDFAFGSIPRQTISSNIDYAQIDALTSAGIIGIKVWLNKGNKITNFVNN